MTLSSLQGRGFLSISQFGLKLCAVNKIWTIPGCHTCILGRANVQYWQGGNQKNNFFSEWDSLCEDGPRTEGIKIFLMAEDP